MDHQGERRNPIIPVELGQVRQLLLPIFPGRPLSSIELVTGGYSNTNYKIQFSGAMEPLLLRLFSNGEEFAKKEIELLNLLSKDFSVPKVISASYEKKEVPYCFALLEWKDGKPLNQVFWQLNAGELFEVGQELGRVLHQLKEFKFAQMGLLDSQLQIIDPIQDLWSFYSKFIEDCLVRGRAGERLGTNLTQKVLNLAHSYRNELSSLTDSSLVHGDFNAKNILMELQNGRWKVNAVLDWEFAFSGPYLTDLGNLLRYDEKFPKDFESGLVDGYQQGGFQLPAGWKKTAKLLDLMNLCDFLNSKSTKPILWTDSKYLISDTLQRWHLL